MIERGTDGFALALATGSYRHHDSQRFCPASSCVDPGELCARCGVPRLTPAARDLNIRLVREGKAHASAPGSAMTRAEASRRGWQP